MQNRFFHIQKTANKFIKTAALNMQEHNIIKNYKNIYICFVNEL